MPNTKHTVQFEGGNYEFNVTYNDTKDHFLFFLASGPADLSQKANDHFSVSAVGKKLSFVSVHDVTPEFQKAVKMVIDKIKSE